MTEVRTKIWNLLALAGALLFFAVGVLAQVSPAEVRDPQLKAFERTYLDDLKALNKDIESLKFEYPLVLSRFVGLDPKEQTGADTRGIEFVRFHDRTVLKVSANYNAAFRAENLTQNQRADRVLSDAIVPILQLMPKYFAGKSGFDAIGFEVAYHVRTAPKKYDYEGKEILALVFSRRDALRFAATQDEARRQEILSNCEIFVDGKEFGLALGERDPLTIGQLEKNETSSLSHDQDDKPSVPETSHDVVLATTEPTRLPPEHTSSIQYGVRLPEPPVLQKPSTPILPQPSANQVLAQSELDAIQAKYQAKLDVLAKDGEGRFRFVSYAPPSFIAFQDRIYLQLTLRNPAVFDKEQTSIYRRSARTFDLFLAPMLKDILSKVPPAQEIAGLDVTVLTGFSQASSSSSEAIEFVCPYAALEQFSTYRITNQDLINQSVVLVNGVRIALDLQKVE